MITTLENLNEDWHLKQQREMAEDIVKYQNFKTDIAIERMRGNVSTATKRNYIVEGRRYLRVGETYTKGKILTKRMLSLIDECIARHVQPLTPSESERLRELAPRQRKEKPVMKIDILDKPLTANIEYGVQIDKTIYLQDDEKCAQAFISGLRALNKDVNAMVVTVELGVVG